MWKCGLTERVLPVTSGCKVRFLFSSRGAPDVGADRWYAIHVRSRHEKTVENSLRGKGYSVFSPSYRTRRKRVDRIAEIEVALFPGYVFCQFDANKRLPILMTPGVVGVVGRGNRAEPVDDTEIASIRTIALSGRPVQPWPFLRIGAADSATSWSPQRARRGFSCGSKMSTIWSFPLLCFSARFRSSSKRTLLRRCS